MNETARIITKLAEQLRRRGVNPRVQVRAGDRVADIVTDTAVYEVRAMLTADVLRDAIRQVQVARDALDPSLKMVIVGRHPGADPVPALAEAKAAGITVNFWTEKSSQLN